MFASFFKKFSQPWVILLVCILAFGLQVFWLGYYIDDWIILNAYNTGGIERLRMYSFLDNRPLVFWIWWIGFIANGVTPVLWQIWAVVWRFLTVISFWVVLRELWPQHKRQVLITSLLFAVYPIFFQQATALTYSFHWICFTLFFLSLYFTILSIKRPDKFGWFTLLAILTGGIELFSQEFFVGLELFRPFVMFYLLSGTVLSLKTRLRRVFLSWLPYLVLMGAYIVWRFVIQPGTSAVDRNAPTLFTGLGSSFLEKIIQLAQFAMQDILGGLLGAWSRTVQPDLFAFSPIGSLVTLALIGLTFFSLFLILPRIFQNGSSPEVDSIEPWYRSAILLGLAALILGFAPGWAIGRHYTDPSGLYNDRFGLPAMAGAALVVTGVIERIISSPKIRLAIFCALIALSVGSQFRAEADYRHSWESQTRFFWELSWRAPQLKQPTAIFSEGTLFKYMGGFANKAAFNQAYAFNQYSPFTPYWYFDTFRSDPVPILENRQPISEARGTMSYSGSRTDNLVIQFHPEEGQCVWVLDSSDSANPYLTDNIKALLPLSNLDKIQPGPASLNASLFGQQPAPFWCYYYEKGALAAQMGQWDEAERLWKESQQKGFKPSVGVELFPFILAAAQNGDWQLAQDISTRANIPADVMGKAVCSNWQMIFQKTPSSAGRDQAIQMANDQQGCNLTVK